MWFLFYSFFLTGFPLLYRLFPFLFRSTFVIWNVSEKIIFNCFDNFQWDGRRVTTTTTNDGRRWATIRCEYAFYYSCRYSVSSFSRFLVSFAIRFRFAAVVSSIWSCWMSFKKIFFHFKRFLFFFLFWDFSSFAFLHFKYCVRWKLWTYVRNLIWQSSIFHSTRICFFFSSLFLLFSLSVSFSCFGLFVRRIPCANSNVKLSLNLRNDHAKYKTQSGTKTKNAKKKFLRKIETEPNRKLPYKL